MFPILSLRAGTLVWAHDDVKVLLGNIAEVTVCITYPTWHIIYFKADPTPVC